MYLNGGRNRYPLLVVAVAFLGASFLACEASTAREDGVVTTDICIYGGTSGGVIAAVQASRMGKRAVIIEPGRHLGGMSSGGLGWTDFGNKRAIGGLSHNFYQRVGKAYGKDIEYNLEPHVAERIFEQYAEEANAEVYFDQRLTGVKRSGKRIVEIVTTGGMVCRAKVFIDATYEGDLLAAAGFSYSLGRESTNQYNESQAGIQGLAQSPAAGKFLVRLDPYRTPGQPESGLIPLVSGEPLGAIGAADHRIQSYNYRVCLTRDDDNKIPLNEPEDYDEADFELLARWIEARIEQAVKSAGRVLTAESMSLRDFLKYDPLPNGKFDFNNRWSISTDYMGGSHDYPEADWEQRRRIARAHENYLRGFFHFLATSPRVPPGVRREMGEFGLCRDEFVATSGWPHQLYVREGRRMVGDFVMCQQHCEGELPVPHAVGLGAYGIDIHSVRRIVIDGQITNEGSNGGRVPQPYPIAYEALLPKEAECENFAAPFCLSASHVAFGSIRMEPVFMVLSQSAATAACMAIDNQCGMHAVDFAALRQRLLEDGQVLQWTATP